jgi:hypothetical protein
MIPGFIFSKEPDWRRLGIWHYRENSKPKELRKYLFYLI